MELHSHLPIFFLLSVSILSSSSLFSSREQDGHVCISQGGRFPRFSLDGRFPRQSSKGPDDLTFCRVYRKRTCCSAAQTHPALVAIRKLASDGEGSQECLMFWEAMECAICDPRVGVKQGPPVLCVSFCESSMKACGDAFFSVDPVSQVLSPCGPRDTICARAKEWASNGTEFCQLAGFAVPSSNSIGSTFCFDGKASLDTTMSSAGQEPGKKGSHYKVKSVRQRLRRLVRQMDAVEAVLWAVGGLVSTGGVILIRRRCLSSQRKKTAMLRIVQEARSKQSASKFATNKRNGKRE